MKMNLIVNKKAFIFDMDGVIINSEPLWREAQINELAKHNISISVNDCINKTMGLRLRDIAIVWCQSFNLSVSADKLAINIKQSVISLIEDKGVAKEGLYQLLNYLKSSKYKIAIATSSNIEIVYTVLNRLKITSYFDSICSADDEKLGKPHPDVYISAARKLNVSSKECIVLEDSYTGLCSAKSAFMTTLIIPENIEDKRFLKADEIFKSMIDVVDYLLTKDS